MANKNTEYCAFPLKVTLCGDRMDFLPHLLQQLFYQQGLTRTMSNKWFAWLLLFYTGWFLWCRHREANHGAEEKACETSEHKYYTEIYRRTESPPQLRSHARLPQSLGTNIGVDQPDTSRIWRPKHTAWRPKIQCQSQLWEATNVACSRNVSEVQRPRSESPIRVQMAERHDSPCVSVFEQRGRGKDPQWKAVSSLIGISFPVTIFKLKLEQKV